MSKTCLAGYKGSNKREFLLRQRERVETDLYTREINNWILISSSRFYEDSNHIVAVNGYIKGVRSEETLLENNSNIFANFRKKRPEGSYRILIYNKLKDELKLYTDPLSTRNLFYMNGETFCFADHLGGILANPKYSREIDREKISRLLVSRATPLTEDTLFKQVEKLGHASELRRSSKNTEINRYWDAYKRRSDINAQNTKRILKNILFDHTRDLVSEADQINLFLSGGLDSTLIAAFIAQETDREINAYTYNEPREEYKIARETAKFLDLNQIKMTADIDEFDEYKLWSVGEPRPDVFRQHGINNGKDRIENAFYGDFAELIFPARDYKFEMLKKGKMAKKLIKPLYRPKLTKAVDKKLRTKFNPGLKVLVSDYYSAADIYSDEPSDIPKKKIIPGNNDKIAEKLMQETDNRFNLENRPIQQNYEYLMQFNRISPQLASVRNNVTVFYPYSSTKLIETAQSLPFNPKKRNEIQKSLLADFSDKLQFSFYSSGLSSHINDIYAPIIQENKDKFIEDIEVLFERELLENNPLDFVDTGKIHKLSNDSVYYLFRIWCIEKYLEIFLDRSKPWKPPS